MFIPIKKASLVLLTGATFFSVTSLAQSVPVLEKHWSGTVSATTADLSKKNAPLTYLDTSASIEILSQEGSHIRFLFKTPEFESIEIGTLSVDGKTLQIAYQYGAGTYHIDGKKMSGCGVGRVKKLMIKTMTSAWCDEFTSSK